MGRDVRAWPMLALLVLVVLVAIGCVLWFMREAMRNERLAVREKLAEAYRAQLSLIQVKEAELWKKGIAGLDGSEPAAARFASCVREGLADSVICFDDQGNAAYPQTSRPPWAGTTKAADALQTHLRSLVQAGKTEEAVSFVIEKFASPDSAAIVDEQGRLVAANAELLALELLTDKNDPRSGQLRERLHGRITNYNSGKLSSAQRTFLMHSLQRIDPASPFPTLVAEDLAARYLDTNPVFVRDTSLRPSGLRDIWTVFSPGGRVIALFSTTGLRSRMDAVIRDSALPKGVSVAVIAPGEEAMKDSTLATAAMGTELPGWRLSLSLDDRAIFTSAADQRVARYLAIGSIVIAAMSVLAIFIGRGFGRQMELARLKNDLVATVSHELKTPLAAMRALVDTLLDAGEFDQKTTHDYLQLLSAENARLSRLIDNFLTFSRLERNKFKFDFTPVSPQRIVESAVAAFGERSHAPGCLFETCVAADLPAICGDFDALVTALLNLLDNAWKYSGDEKRIVLRAEACNDRVRFAVQDNGIGLSPRECRRIFRRFYQSDQRLSRNAGGCGLGLSIMKSIVEAHGGRSQVTSEPGAGSTFGFEIPSIKPGTT